MIQHLAISGYRSLQQLNLHRALRLIVAAARGDLVRSLASEGGLPAALWAGPERHSTAMRRGEQPVQGGPRSGPVRLRLGFAADPFSYAIELGYPGERGSAFALDPEIKREVIWAGLAYHPRAVLLDQASGPVGPGRLPAGGVLAGGADPAEHPEVFALREQILSWRFYDTLRSDPRAPARHPGIASRCAALAEDGADLPAALRTIEEIGDWQGLQVAIADAFPGCQLGVDVNQPVFRLRFQQPGLLRPLEAAELSDGTLRYVLLCAALFSPRLPPLLVLNEPEASLHPQLLAPLARLIAAVSRRTQVWVIAHAPALVEVLATEPGCRHHQLQRELGATVLPEQTVLEKAAWRWPV